MSHRVIHPAQQGARLSWLNDLFEQVPALDAAPAVRELIPVPEAVESEFIDLDDADALQLIEAMRRQLLAQFDSPDTLFYLDPPYVHGTRTLGNPYCAKHRYAFELDDDAHRGMAEALHEVEGMVVLSGYPCALYDNELFGDWERHERATHADGARDRTEVVWLNPACSAALERSRGGLFAEVAA